ncbi:hypothetical protein BJ741DRAFT_715851 [Chytriomyces cf. hyalinus JEL632]|nr:hypothetical protein BJ741DRAFT_715851 [Chytriomyces cf. hyalinus JEL632]
MSQLRVVNEYKLNQAQFDWLVLQIQAGYQRGLAKAVASGIPRLKELINAAKNLKTPSMTVYLDKSVAQNKVAAETLRARLKHTTLGDITQVSEIHNDPDCLHSTVTADKIWMDVLAKIPDPDRVSPTALAPWVVRLVLDRDSLNSRDLGVRDIVQKIKMFGVNASEQEWVSNHHFWNQFLADLLSNVTSMVSQCTTGVFGSMNVTKEYIIETEGINLRGVMKVKDVDAFRVYCNVFGIEIARESLLNEIRGVIEDAGSAINYCHLVLLVETIDILLDAAVHGEKDGIRGVAESVLVGAVAKMGTGAVDILLDDSRLFHQSRVFERDSSYCPLNPSYLEVKPDVDERDAEIKKLREQLERERSLRQNAEKQLESGKQAIQNADERDAEINSLKAQLEKQTRLNQEAEVVRGMSSLVQNRLEKELDRLQSMLGQVQPETLKIIGTESFNPRFDPCGYQLDQYTLALIFIFERGVELLTDVSHHLSHNVHVNPLHNSTVDIATGPISSLGKIPFDQGMLLEFPFNFDSFVGSDERDQFEVTEIIAMTCYPPR